MNNPQKIDVRLPNEKLFYWVDSRYNLGENLAVIIKIRATANEREFISMLFRMPQEDRMAFRAELQKTICVIPKLLFTQGE